MKLQKNHYFPYNTFINGWYIPHNICDNIIQYFEENISLQEDGKVFTKHGPDILQEVKECKEIGISPNNFNFPFLEYRQYLQLCVEKYEKKYFGCSRLSAFNVNTVYNIQKYPIGGGFKKFHCERQHNFPRVLVFMTYLNDVEDGGTRFHYQRITTQAKKGLTIIWPTDFTHFHKGIISKTKEKYIVTGWFTFNKL